MPEARDLICLNAFYTDVCIGAFNATVTLYNTTTIIEYDCVIKMAIAKNEYETIDTIDVHGACKKNVFITDDFVLF